MRPISRPEPWDLGAQFRDEVLTRDGKAVRIEPTRNSFPASTSIQRRRTQLSGGNIAAGEPASETDHWPQITDFQRRPTSSIYWILGLTNCPAVRLVY